MIEEERGNLKRRWAELKGRKRAADIATVFAMGVALVAGAASFTLQEFIDPKLASADLSAEEMDAMYSRIQSAQLQIAKLQREQEALLGRPSSDPANVQMQLLAERVRGIEASQARIERAILSDPAKALEVPLLKRDVESVREANVQGLAAVRQSVDQVYDLSKWLLGALVVGIFSLALSNLLTKRS